MEKIRSRKIARITTVAAVALSALVGCGGGGGDSFDVDGFADMMSQDGGLTKEQATCIGEYIDKEGSDNIKSELQEAIDEGEDAPEPDEATFEELVNLMTAASTDCITG